MENEDYLMCGSIEAYPRDDDAELYRSSMVVARHDKRYRGTSWIIPDDNHVVSCVRVVLWKLRFARGHVPGRLRSIVISERG